jgi:hypothetical protein
MIRITASVLRRSGAQFLTGERWTIPGDLGELAAAIAALIAEALDRYGDEVGQGRGELVLRVADRRFKSLDPPTDLARPVAAGAKPSVASRNDAPIKRSKYQF